jgi:SAM-dependent methyltransferase
MLCTVSAVNGTDRFYAELADWWPLFSHPDDYREEAAWAWEALAGAAPRPVTSLLELGSGGGNNAAHLKSRCALTLTDVSPGMIEVSRRLNPECEHHVADMRSVRLGRTFDAVYVHDAIGYMTTQADLLAALRSCAAHLPPGRPVLLQPDYVAENFAADTAHGGHDGPDGRGLRYLEWTLAPGPGSTTFETHYAFLLREPGRPLRLVHDRHVQGVFTTGAWLGLLAQAGFEGACAVEDGWGRTNFLARRAPAA